MNIRSVSPPGTIDRKMWLCVKIDDESVKLKGSNSAIRYGYGGYRSCARDGSRSSHSQKQPDGDLRPWLDARWGEAETRVVSRVGRNASRFRHVMPPRQHSPPPDRARNASVTNSLLVVVAVPAIRKHA